MSDSSEIVREQSESVAATSAALLASGPAFYSNLAMANAVASQQGMQQIQAAIIGKIAESIISSTPSGAGVDVAALMQLLSAAQNLAPKTP